MLTDPTHGSSYDPNEYINRSNGTGPTHGGSFDPREDLNRSSRGQLENTKPSQAWRTPPSHGGDYDPNQFDVTRLPGQSQGQRFELSGMASNAAQGATYH